MLFDVPQAEVQQGERTLASIRQDYRRYMALSHERGGLITVSQAALILGVSRQRVQQLVAAQRLNVIEILDGRYLYGDEIIAWAESEKIVGRPTSKFKIWTAGLNRK
jgi:hypothetical protein